MNRVSDLKLALACAEAGIIPSLIPYPDFNLFLQNLTVYKDTGKEIFAAIDLSDVVHPVYHEKILNSCITHIELIEYSVKELTEFNLEKIQQLRNAGIKIIIKVLSHVHVHRFLSIIDGVTVKGSEGAGRSLASTDLITEIKKIKELYPNLIIIASGGVKNKEDIDKLLSSGAHAVSIGTMFALSTESSIPESTKRILLDKKAEDITRVAHGAQQRAIVFNTGVYDGNTNNTSGLEQGIQTGNSGHIFIGNAISEVHDILSVDSIVKKLMGVNVFE